MKLTTMVATLQVLIHSRHAPLTATEICQRIGHSSATFQRVIRALREDGSVIEVREASTPVYLIVKLPYWCAHVPGLPVARMPPRRP